MCSATHPVRYEIARANANAPGQFNSVWQSEIAQNTANPMFKPQKLSLTLISNGSEDAPFRINICTGQRILGYVETTVKDCVQKRSFDVVTPQGVRGVLNLTGFRVFERPTFFDYLKRGTQISLVLAIDYTGSNGDPSTASSLHYLGPNNQYEAAIASVGQIVEPYDPSAMFSTFGFGGIP